MVVCHPGTIEVAKSKDTIECTENTKGVAKPASTNETISNLFHRNGVDLGVPVFYRLRLK